MYPCKFGSGVQCFRLYLFVSKIHAGIGADLGKAIPLVHAKLAHAHVDIESIIILWVDLSLSQVIFHRLVNLFAVFDLADQSPPRLGEISNATRHESFPPKMRLLIRSLGSLSSANTDKYAHFAAWPLVAYSFIEHHGRRVVLSNTLVQENRLTDLDRLEGKCRGACRTASLPDGSIWFDGRLFSGVVGAQEDLTGGGILRAPIDGGDGAVEVSRHKGFDLGTGLRFGALLSIVV